MSLRTPRAGIIQQGTVTVGTEAAAIGTGECGSVVVKAAADNGAAIYVGNAEVSTSEGFPLAAGESVSLFVGSLDAVYVVAGSNLTAHFLALSRE